MKLHSVILMCCLIAPFMLSGQTQPNLENGYKAYGSYDGSGLDDVNLMNGNLTFHGSLPGSYPQRGGSLQVEQSLYYSGKAWQVLCPTDSSGNSFCEWFLISNGMAVQNLQGITVQRTVEQSGSGTGGVIFTVFGYSLAEPSGATHELYPAGNGGADGKSVEYEAIDTSGFHLEASNPDSNGVMSAMTVTDRHGRQYQGTFDEISCGRMGTNNLGPIRLGGGTIAPLIDDAPMGDQYCTQSVGMIASLDSNGNTMGSTDTLGRTAPFTGSSSTTDYTGCSSLQPVTAATVISYNAPDGTNRSMKFCFSAIALETAFGVAAIEVQNIPGQVAPKSSVLTSIVLADGTHWTFSYDSYTDLTYIGLPTGGSISYSWSTIPFTAPCQTLTTVSRAVSTRILNDGQGHSSVWRYSWGTSANGVLRNIVTDPLGNDTAHTFTLLTGAGASCGSFFETQTQFYQGAASAPNLVKQVDTTYSSAVLAIDVGSAEVSNVGNVVPISIQTTLYPGQKTSLITRQYDKGLGPNAPIFGNVTVEKQYDWGQGTPGPLLREIDTTYQWQVEGRYLTAHLLDLTASVSVIDPNGVGPQKSNCPGWDINGNAVMKTCAAESDYFYDEPLYLTSAGISSQHAAPPHDVRGNLTTVKKWINNSSSVLSHTNWYDTGEPYQNIDPLGHTTTFSYDPVYVGAYITQTCLPQTGSVAHCVSGTYDFATGVLTSFTDQNHLTSNFGYDLMFHLVSAQGPLDPNNNNGRPTDTFQYSTSSAPNTFPITVTHLKSITSSTSDSVTTTYDGLGRVIKTQHQTPSGTATLDTSYDPVGRVGSVSNPYFATSDPTYGLTQTIYDPLGRPLLVQESDGSFATNTYQGNCTLSEDEAAKGRRTCIDTLGRLVEVEEPGDFSAPAPTDMSGTTSLAATAIVSITGSEQVKTFPPPPPPKCPRPPEPCDQTSDPPPPPIYDSGTLSIIVNGHSTSTNFGSADTASSVATNIANAINLDSAAAVNASVSGTQVALTARVAGQAGDYTASFSTTWDTVNFSQPSFSGIVSNSRLLGGSDLNQFAHTYVTLYGYDALGDMLCVEQHGNATGSGCSSDPSLDGTSPWRVRRFTYDSLSRLLTAHNPESGTITYSYDSDGNLLTKTDARGVVTNFSPADSPIDALHRVTKTTYSDGTPSVTFGYDIGCCAVDPKYGVGRLTYEQTATTELVFVYDVMGHVTGQADCPPSGIARGYCYGLGATYDLAGNQRSLVYPDGRAIAYNYNSGNQLNKVQLSSVNGAPNGFTYWSVADANFLPTGQPSAISLGNGDSETQHFNKRLQLSEKLLSGASLGTLADHVFNYGSQNNGNVQSVADQLNSAYAQTYSYDQLNRLLTANESRWGMSYVYDGWGNYLQQNQTGGTTYQHQYTAAVNNRLNGYTYDLAGNMLADGVHQYTYDGENQIKTVDSTAASYTYNPEGNRVRKDAGSNSTEYFYFGGEVIAELDQAGNWVDYIYAGGNRIARSDTNLVDIVTWGTQCSGCPSGQFVSYSFANAGGLSGYVIRPGDKLYVAQYQNTGTSAGPGLGFSDGTFADAYNISDQDGQKWTADSFVNTWHYRRFDLTSLAGKTISSVYFETNPATAPGNWRALYGNLVLESADGTVHPIYTRENSIWLGVNAPTQMTGTYAIDQYTICVTCSGDVTTYYHDDQIGSSRIMTGVGGWPIWQGTFLPYGEEYNPQITTNHFKFSGKERDTESGLDYFGARYYSNGLGRFITPDWAAKAVDVPYAEFADPQSLNLYSYVRNIPTVRVDPDGHWPTLLAPVAERVAQEVGKDIILVIGAEPVILFATAVKTVDFVDQMVNPQSVGESNADAQAAIRQGSQERAAENGGVDPQQAPEPAAASGGARKGGGTYTLVDPVTGKVMRTGRTGDLSRRQGEHARGKETKDLVFRVDKRTNNRAAQRGREQIIHDKHKPPLNKIRPISPTNAKRNHYLREGKKLGD